MNQHRAMISRVTGLIYNHFSDVKSFLLDDWRLPYGAGLQPAQTLDRGARPGRLARN